MRTYKLTVAYDGSRFRGWQRQPDTDLTIQGILEKNIAEIVGYRVEVNGSGRTDGGVHARGQTASVVLSGKVDEDTFLTDLNAMLPEDIRALEMQLVKNGFHARHSARGKCYEYVIDTAEKAEVFGRKYTFHYPYDLDLEKMRTAADYLLGTHDFAGFTDRVDENSTVRRIDEIKIERICEEKRIKENGIKQDRIKQERIKQDKIDEGSSREEGMKIRIRYRGSGFMYHMVRILTGTLLEVGTGARTPESVRTALTSGRRADAGFLAPASGLCLMDVLYEREVRDNS